MAKERSDFSGPIGDRVQWQEKWELFTNRIIGTGSQMEGIGPRRELRRNRHGDVPRLGRGVLLGAAPRPGS